MPRDNQTGLHTPDSNTTCFTNLRATSTVSFDRMVLDLELQLLHTWWSKGVQRTTLNMRRIQIGLFLVYHSGYVLMLW